MGDISTHFSRWEYRCQCQKEGKPQSKGYCGGRFDTPVSELLLAMEAMHSYYSKKYGKVRIDITSGCRCYLHNLDIVGLEFSHSMHLFAKANDFKVFIVATNVQIRPAEINRYLSEKYPDRYGRGVYTNRNHLDVRTEYAYWDER